MPQQEFLYLTHKSYLPYTAYTEIYTCMLRFSKHKVLQEWKLTLIVRPVSSLWALRRRIRQLCFLDLPETSLPLAISAQPTHTAFYFSGFAVGIHMQEHTSTLRLDGESWPCLSQGDCRAEVLHFHVLFS